MLSHIESENSNSDTDDIDDSDSDQEKGKRHDYNLNLFILERKIEEKVKDLKEKIVNESGRYMSKRKVKELEGISYF